MPLSSNNTKIINILPGCGEAIIKFFASPATRFGVVRRNDSWSSCCCKFVRMLNFKFFKFVFIIEEDLRNVERALLRFGISKCIAPL